MAYQQTTTVSRRETTRRGFLRNSALAVGGLSLSGAAAALASEASAPAENEHQASRSFRLALLTDVHLQPERGAEAGFVQALRHVQSLNDKPELILNGGDAIMDALAVNDKRTTEQWTLWNKVLRDECSLPVLHCIGNHDIWGWNKKASGTTGREPGWGKQSAVDQLGLKGRYYSVDRGGWRFLVLDSSFPDEKNTYIAQIDDEQFAWLEQQLQQTPRDTHVAVVSHIPILSVSHVEFSEIFIDEPRRRLGATHADAKRLVRLFRKHPQVKLALSGHLHLTERIEYAGVTYLSGGAVSGNWWRGPHYGTAEGYLIVDLFDDGHARQQYMPYDWQFRDQ